MGDNNIQIQSLSDKELLDLYNKILKHLDYLKDSIINDDLEKGDSSE
jgi:hypothetical protein